jgi:hypothetical protein
MDVWHGVAIPYNARKAGHMGNLLKSTILFQHGFYIVICVDQPRYGHARESLFF